MTFGTLTAKCVDDSVNTCDCCGRTDLKATVLMVSDTGAEFHFGRVCAARNSGKTSQQLTKEMRADRDAAQGRAGNQLMDIRRQGVPITRQVVLDVCNGQKVHVESLPIILRVWVRA
jgi:hypothetical protein